MNKTREEKAAFLTLFETHKREMEAERDGAVKKFDAFLFEMSVHEIVAREMIAKAEGGNVVRVQFARAGK